ncbi:MAG: helix-turn-helix domain-containing protein [Desulfotalea sp.]
MIGSRLASARLQRNQTQAFVAETAGISINAVQKAEKGVSTLPTYIKIMRVLKLLDQIDSFLPEPTISPIAIAKMQGKKRTRASNK